MLGPLSLSPVFATARAYLAGAATLAELNGEIANCIAEARILNCSDEIIRTLEGWQVQVDRCWNEWGQHAQPLTKAEFRSWIRDEILVFEDKAD